MNIDDEIKKAKKENAIFVNNSLLILEIAFDLKLLNINLNVTRKLWKIQPLTEAQMFGKSIQLNENINHLATQSST